MLYKGVTLNSLQQPFKPFYFHIFSSLLSSLLNVSYLFKSLLLIYFLIRMPTCFGSAITSPHNNSSQKVSAENRTKKMLRF